VRASLDKLSQHLAHETTLMRTFLDILDAETRALVAPIDGQALAAVVHRKTVQADALQAAAQTRAMLLATLGFADARQDLGPVVRQYPALHPAIDTLVALATQARAKNQENGIAIQIWQRHHQDALSALQSLPGTSEPRLYDARGRIGKHRHLHRMAQATTIPAASEMHPSSSRGGSRGA